MRKTVAVFLKTFGWAVLLGAPAVFSQATPPPPHRLSQVQSILGPYADSAGPFPPLHIVIVWGPHDHLPGEHEYGKFDTAWSALLSKLSNVTVSSAFNWPSAAQWNQAGLVLFNLRTLPTLTDSNFRQIDDYLARGKGIVNLHVANHPDVSYESKWADRFGVAWANATTTYREGFITLNLLRTTNHPVLAGMPDTLMFRDEVYFPMAIRPGVQILATSIEQGAAHPAIWTFSPNGNGRVYGFVMGHNYFSFSDPLFRILLLRGMAWAAGETLGRFRPAVLDGAVYVNDATRVRRLAVERALIHRRQGRFSEELLWMGPGGQSPRSLRIDGRRTASLPFLPFPEVRSP